MTPNYTPYGPEWEKELMKLSKKDLIEMIRKKALSVIGEGEWIELDNNVVEDKWYLLYNGHWIGIGKYKPNEDNELGEPDWQDETSEYISPYPTHYMTLPNPPSLNTK